MRRKILSILLPAMASSMMLLSSCGNSAANTGSDAAASSAAETSTEEKKTDAAAEENGSTQIANPWEDNVSEQEVYVITGAYFIVLPDATDVVYRVNPSDHMAEMDFKLDGLDYTARMKATDKFEDISGLYYEWDVDDEQDVTGSEGRDRRAITDGETIDSLLWLDKNMGIMFSLSTSDKDLDGFDIVGIAEQMYQPAPEAEEFMPGSFVEEAAGKNTFESYDELLSYLKTDNGYTYFELEGYDGKLLAVSEGTYDDQEGHRAAIEATFYGDFGGSVKFIGNAFSGGTAYPIRCDGTMIYDAGGHTYESEFFNETGDALIVKDYISEDYDENGNVSYSGFLRENNTSEGDDIPSDTAEAGKLFESFFAEYEKKPVMDFTVVK